MVKTRVYTLLTEHSFEDGKSSRGKVKEEGQKSDQAKRTVAGASLVKKQFWWLFRKKLYILLNNFCSIDIQG